MPRCPDCACVCSISTSYTLNTCTEHVLCAISRNIWSMPVFTRPLFHDLPWGSCFDMFLLPLLWCGCSNCSIPTKDKPRGFELNPIHWVASPSPKILLIGVSQLTIYPLAFLLFPFLFLQALSQIFLCLWITFFPPFFFPLQQKWNQPPSKITEDGKKSTICPQKYKQFEKKAYSSQHERTTNKWHHYLFGLVHSDRQDRKSQNHRI